MVTLQTQEQAVGFGFTKMPLTMVAAWALPSLTTQVIRGSDTPRDNIARLAVDFKKLCQPANPTKGRPHSKRPASKSLGIPTDQSHNLSLKPKGILNTAHLLDLMPKIVICGA